MSLFSWWCNEMFHEKNFHRGCDLWAKFIFQSFEFRLSSITLLAVFIKLENVTLDLEFKTRYFSASIALYQLSIRYKTSYPRSGKIVMTFFSLNKKALSQFLSLSFHDYYLIIWIWAYFHILFHYICIYIY